MTKMLRLALVTAFCVALALPALADGPRHYPRGKRGYQTQMMTRLRLGLMTPEGDSKFWSDNRHIFSGDAKGLEDASWALDFDWALGPRASVAFSSGYFKGQQNAHYLDYVDAAGDDVFHVASLKLAPITVGLTFYPGGRDRSINPYVGAGGGFYWWRYREVGDFIVFDQAGDPDVIEFDAFESDGIAVGYYTVVGVDLKIAPTMSVFGEARWTFAEDEMSDQFDGFGTIDLSGKEISIGLAWRF